MSRPLCVLIAASLLWLLLGNSALLLKHSTEFLIPTFEAHYPFKFRSTPVAKQLETFLEQYPDSPGALFVHLLRQHLHLTSRSEAERLLSCRKNTNLPLCFGGWRSYNAAQEAVGKKNNVDMEKQTQLVALSDDENDASRQTVYSIRRYEDNHHVIPNLGTQTACLPLMLAGYAATKSTINSTVVELGPFAGLSSKCILTGMSKNGVREGAYTAFDTFEGKANYNAISRSAQWLSKSDDEHPQFDRKHTDFLWLWERAVKSVYPSARGSKGWINAESLNPTTLQHQQVNMISIDSAKSAQQLLSQLEGLGTIQAGTILFLMDFEFVSQQIKQVYACLRQEHLLPVYASLTMEHWAWVVRHPLKLDDNELGNCYRSVKSDLSSHLERMETMIRQDIAFLGSMSEDRDDPTWPQMRAQEHLISQLHGKMADYDQLAAMYPERQGKNSA